jgi:hypothetical protein
MKKIILLLLLGTFICSVNLTFSQEEDVPLPKSLRKYSERDGEKKLNLTAGGSFGMQFGSYTAVSGSPIFGYYPAKWLLLGVGGTYMFSYIAPLDYSSHAFGATAFAEGLIWKQRIIAHIGYEYINYEDAKYDPTTLQITGKERKNDHALLIGPGYRQPVTDNINMYLLCLFNIFQTSESFYSNPTIRIGITVDF